MEIVITAVGRLRAGPERDLVEQYRRRIIWPLTIKEVEDRRGSGPERRARECAMLRAAIPDGAAVVVLDEGGQDLTSSDFAARVGAWRDQGRRHLAFVIGGAEGLDPSLRDMADLVLALGRVTWPHLLVRGLLMEQLYRAQQIVAGHPYHRD